MIILKSWTYCLVFGSTGVWIQGLTLARLVFYHLSHSASLTFSFWMLLFIIYTAPIITMSGCWTRIGRVSLWGKGRGCLEGDFSLIEACLINSSPHNQVQLNWDQRTHDCVTPSLLWCCINVTQVFLIWISLQKLKQIMNTYFLQSDLIEWVEFQFCPGCCS
jgi:hypothetical protein